MRSLTGSLREAGEARDTGGRRTLVFKSPGLKSAHRGTRVAERPRMPERRPLRPNIFLRLAQKRGIGLTAAALMFGSVGSYGATLGNHWPEVQDFAVMVPDALARAAGFGIDSITVDGRVALTDQEILTALNFGQAHSLLFLDAKAARERLLQMPLVSEATVRKLYPNTLTVTVVEREPFALWQKDGQLLVMAADGTVIDEARDGRFSHLPLVVGNGANTKARDFLNALAKHPELKDKIYAAVRVGERRWNLRMSNGVDVKLPEEGYGAALDRLAALVGEQKLLDKDIVNVDLRLAERTTVKLSDAAFEAAQKDAKPAKKGGAT